MKNSILKFLPVLALAGFMVSCEEDGSIGDGKAEEKLANYFLEAEAIASNAYSIMDQAKRKLTGPGDTVIINNAMVYQMGSAINIDYGNGVVDKEGINRAGVIAVTESADYFTSGGGLSATFTNYKVDDKTIDGTVTVTNQGANQMGIAINGFSYNGEFTYQANKNIDWTSGFTTKDDETDDRFEISGSSNGTETANNNGVTATFTEKLKVDRSCQYGVTQGVIDLALTSDSIGSITFDKAMLDFISADGCDNKVTIKISNGDSEITLPRTFNGF